MLTPCPRCSAGLTGGPACNGCGLPLTGPVALHLWQVDQRIADMDHRLAGLRNERQQLWSEHVRLVVELSQDAPLIARPFTGADVLPPVPAPPLAPAWALQAAPRQWTPPPAEPRQEWTPRRVQNLLLTVGALLLVIAGAIFTAVSWRHLGAAVRGAILLSLTGVAAAGCRSLARRGLTATAEAVSGVCLGLGVFDAYAFHALVLPDVSRSGYWAVATAALAAGAAALGRLTKVRVPWIAAGGLALLPLVILCADATRADQAILLSLDALLAACSLAALRRIGASRTVTDLRGCWLAGGAGVWVLGFAMSATHVLYGLRGQPLAPIMAAIALTAGSAAIAAWSEGSQPVTDAAPFLPVASGACALSVLCGVALPFETRLDVTWWALALVVSSFAELIGSFALPSIWRSGPAVSAAAAAALAGSSELPSVLSTLTGQLGWINTPWTAGSNVLGRGATLSLAQHWAGPANLLCLAACAAVAVVAGRLLDLREYGFAVAGGLVAITALVATAQLGGSYALGLSVDLGIVALAAVAAFLGRASSNLAKPATAVALVAGGLAAVWSLAVPAASVWVACSLVVVGAAAATAGVPYRQVWSAATVLAAGYAAIAVAHLGGAPQPALGVAATGVPLAVTAGLAVTQRRSSDPRTVDALESTAVVVALAGLLMASHDDGWSSWALLVVAGAAMLSTVRASRRVVAPASVALGLAAVTILPFAQQLAVGAVVAACLAMTGLSIAGACLLAQSRSGQPVAAVLAAGSLVQTACALVSARDAFLTVTLTLLCLVFACVAALPDSRLATAGVDLGFRAVTTGLSAGLLLGAAASVCTDQGLTAPVTGLIVAMVSATLATWARWLKDRQPDATVVELVSVFATVLSLRACFGQPVYAGWVLAVAGLTVLVTATRPDRRGWWPAGAVLISAATWVWLGVAGVTSPEPYTDPIAVVALYVGFTRRGAQPSTPSLTAYGPGLSGLLLPSLAYALDGSGVTRPLLLAALATAVVVVGAQHRLRAPLLFGAVTLVLTAVRLIAPYEQLVPRWLEVGTAGALLLALGSTYEQRRHDLGALRARYDTLL